jgi:hypothetical protein
VQRTVALIPWRSNLALLDKLKDPKQRLWYAQKTTEKGVVERFGRGRGVKYILPPVLQNG